MIKIFTCLVTGHTTLTTYEASQNLFHVAAILFHCHFNSTHYKEMHTIIRCPVVSCSYKKLISFFLSGMYHNFQLRKQSGNGFLSCVLTRIGIDITMKRFTNPCQEINSTGNGLHSTQVFLCDQSLFLAKILPLFPYYHHNKMTRQSEQTLNKNILTSRLQLVSSRQRT